MHYASIVDNSKLEYNVKLHSKYMCICMPQSDKLKERIDIYNEWQS